MVRPHFEEALRELNSALAEVRSTVEFARAAAHLRPRLGRLISWDALKADERTAVQQFISNRQSKSDLVYRGLYVVLCGAFEEFIRRLLRDGVRAVNSTVNCFERLDTCWARRNIYHTGKALATVLEPPDHITLDYDLLCKNIGTCTRGSEGFELNPDAFALFVGNLTTSSLERTLARLGIELQWDEFGTSAELGQVVGETGTRRIGNAVKARIQALAKGRNFVAHNGTGGLVITDLDVEDALDFLGVFAKRLVSIVEAALPL